MHVPIDDQSNETDHITMHTSPLNTGGTKYRIDSMLQCGPPYRMTYVALSVINVFYSTSATSPLILYELHFVVLKWKACSLYLIQCCFTILVPIAHIYWTRVNPEITVLEWWSLMWILMAIVHETLLPFQIQNLHAYDVLAREASSKGVQILIFPEDGIIGYQFSNRSTIHPTWPCSL